MMMNVPSIMDGDALVIRRKALNDVNILPAHTFLEADEDIFVAELLGFPVR